MSAAKAKGLSTGDKTPFAAISYEFLSRGGDTREALAGREYAERQGWIARISNYIILTEKGAAI